MTFAVIFDLDGVIADTHSLHSAAWKRLLQEENRRVSDEHLNIIREGRKREEILRQFFGELSSEEAARLGGRKEELFRTSENSVQPTPGLMTFLDELEEADVPKVVATSASKRRAHETLNQLSIASRFVTIVTGDDVERGKPDPSLFLLAAKYFPMGTTEVLVIEDSKAGVQAAKSAGMMCLGLGANYWAQQLLEAGADYVASSLSEVSWSRLCHLMQSNSDA